jgi:hypothetical protein
MGLQINTQIGTVDGITSSAYVRITNYSISKQGHANFTLETFMSKEDSTSQLTDAMAAMRSMMVRTTQSNQIGYDFRVSLMKEEPTIIMVPGTVSREVSYTNEEGEVVTETRDFNELVEKTIIKEVPDLARLEDISIFTFAYGKLKEKLKETFGGDKVVDA